MAEGSNDGGSGGGGAGGGLLDLERELTCSVRARLRDCQTWHASRTEPSC